MLKNLVTGMRVLMLKNGCAYICQQPALPPVPAGISAWEVCLPLKHWQLTLKLIIQAEGSKGF